MRKHYVYALVLYALGIMAGYVVLVVSGHGHEANTFVNGATAAPFIVILLIFIWGLFL